MRARTDSIQNIRGSSNGFSLTDRFLGRVLQHFASAPADSLTGHAKDVISQIYLNRILALKVCVFCTWGVQTDSMHENAKIRTFSTHTRLIIGDNHTSVDVYVTV